MAGQPAAMRMRRSDIATDIVSATANWPSAKAIGGLVDEYVSEDSQKRRVIILFDILDCLQQDMDSRRVARGESTGMRLLAYRMSARTGAGSAGRPRRGTCSHIRPFAL